MPGTEYKPLSLRVTCCVGSQTERRISRDKYTNVREEGTVLVAESIMVSSRSNSRAPHRTALNLMVLEYGHLLRLLP